MEPTPPAKQIDPEELIEETLREVEAMKARYWSEREAEVFTEIAIERIRQRALRT